MSVVTPLQLTCSWPLIEADMHLGRCWTAGDQLSADWFSDEALPAMPGIGLWECDLATQALRWSDGVYDLFGLPRDAVLARDEVVALYAEPSRAAMERLRAHAIKHRRGFTLDAEIRPASGSARWMRLIAAPVCGDRGRAVRLRGIKFDVTSLYA